MENWLSLLSDSPAYAWLALLPIGSFLAGLSATPHCAVMCGPLFVLFGQGGPFYQVGRVLGYTLIGAVCGVLGASFNLLGEQLALQHSALYLMAALFFVYGIIQILPARWRSRLPGTGALTRLVVRLMGGLHRNKAPDSHSNQNPDAIKTRGPGLALLGGSLSALLPCGALVPLWLLAAGSGSALAGAALSGAFVLGTLPGAALLTWGSQRFGHWFRGREDWRRVAGIVLILAGLFVLGLRSGHFSTLHAHGEHTAADDATCHTP